MGTTNLVESGLVAPVVSADQIDLVKRTVASGATDAELKLFLFDCARQGVHPLDRLIHFTKRAGRYTPITSIDFMRTRAADSGEYAGNDDAEFVGGGDIPDAARVSVYRMVQGTVCKFTATARWSEYKPAENDFMWKRMPHTMLAKCAEALALRKGFPRQLAGLYAKEEMDQAGSPAVLAPDPPATIVDTATGAEVPATTKIAAPAGYHYIHGYQKQGDWHEFSLLNWDAQGGAFEFSTKLDSIGHVIAQAYQQGLPIKVLNYTAKKTGLGGYVNKFDVWKPLATQAEQTAELALGRMAEDAGELF